MRARRHLPHRLGYACSGRARVTDVVGKFENSNPFFFLKEGIFRLVIMTLKHYNVCALHYDFSIFSVFALHCIWPKISNDIKCFWKHQMTLCTNDI